MYITGGWFIQYLGSLVIVQHATDSNIIECLDIVV